jgi:hypothetical protein
MDTTLNHDDLTVLIEAVDSWVNKDATGELMGALFEGMLADKNSPEAEKLKREREEKRLAKDVEHRQRKDSATLLKAKLIMLRQSMPMEATSR